MGRYGRDANVLAFVGAFEVLVVERVMQMEVDGIAHCDQNTQMSWLLTRAQCLAVIQISLKIVCLSKKTRENVNKRKKNGGRNWVKPRKMGNVV